MHSDSFTDLLVDFNAIKTNQNKIIKTRANQNNIFDYASIMRKSMTFAISKTNKRYLKTHDCFLEISSLSLKKMLVAEFNNSNFAPMLAFKETFKIN